MDRTRTQAALEKGSNVCIAIAVIGLLLLAACGGGEQPSALRSASPTPLPLMTPYVPASEFTCMENGFKAHINYGDDQNHSPISSRDLRFSVSDLMSALSSLVACDSGGDIDRAVVVHYGLDENAHLDVLLEMVCLKWDPDSNMYAYSSTDKCYEISGTSLKNFTGGLATWYGESGRGAAYTQQVVIQHSTKSDWTKFDATVDVSSTLFPYEEELDLLITQNELAMEDTLRLLPSAVPLSWTLEPDSSITENNIYQALVWIAEKVTIDNIDYGVGAEYRNKGADMGNPCPYTCPNRRFVLWPNPGPRRPGC